MWWFRRREQKEEAWRVQPGEMVRHKLTGEQLLVIRSRYTREGALLEFHGWEVRNRQMQIFLCSHAELERWTENSHPELSRHVVVPKKCKP